MSRGNNVPTELAPAAGLADAVSQRAWIIRSWLLSRLLTLAILIPERKILGDVRYYWRQLRELFGATGLADVLREYPAPSVSVFVPPWWASAGHQTGYQIGFVLLMLVVDATFTVALWRAAGRRAQPGLRLWLWLGPGLGPLIFTRFDLVPAAFAGGALLALSARRPVPAGALVGAGAVVKLWPAALLPALLVRRGGRGRLVAAFGAVSAVAVTLTVAIGGVHRLLSPLTWQGERGLQIESLAATPLMWAWAIRPGPWSVSYTKFYAYQVDGPWTTALVHASSLATVLALGLVGLLWWRALRWDQHEPSSVLPVAGLLAAATAGLLVITNKTLSPQYLLWLGALLAAVGCMAPEEPLLGRLSWLLVGSCVLTQVLYPAGYDALHTHSGLSIPAVALLSVRNVALVVLTTLLLRRVVELTRPAVRPR